MLLLLMMEALHTENLKKKLHSVDTYSKYIAPASKTYNQIKKPCGLRTKCNTSKIKGKELVKI